MLSAIGRVLRWRGIHYLVTRCAPTRIKSLAFDEKFRAGDWNFAKDGPDELAAVIKTRAHGGDVLMMGCGSASIMADIKAEEFTSILGLDISGEAIRLANRHSAPNVSFQQGDMVSFQSKKAFDLIIFSESFNYVPFYEREPLLRRLCQKLKPSGCILITIAQAHRYRGILTLIRAKFSVLDDRRFQGSNRHLMAFRPRTSQLLSP